MSRWRCNLNIIFTSDRQVSRAIGFAQIVFSKAGVLSLVGPADISDPQGSVWSDSDSGKIRMGFREMTRVLLQISAGIAGGVLSLM